MTKFFFKFFLYIRLERVISLPLHVCYAYFDYYFFFEKAYFDYLKRKKLKQLFTTLKTYWFLYYVQFCIY